MLIHRTLFLFAMLLPFTVLGQSSDQVMQEIEDDLNPGSDIFSDFNEDLESAQVLEDERFYRYGRFFSVNLGGGFTTFTGNRGKAYEDNHPTFHLSVNYFLDFQKAITLGIEYSKHTMILDTVVNGYPDQGPIGAVVTDYSRVFVGYKYYIDTTDLGTAITYSNPHFIGRLEYWYQTSKFIDREIPKDSGGGIGTGIGMGLEFPVELKQSYISVEGIYHVVNFYDKFTQDFRQIPDDPDSTYGFEDLTGNVFSLVITYNFTW
ncbi:MAG: hypothetical protein NDI69_00375 [Bacteriovoracaceae bacterium]|nr:hypothetical protein [Bacteriovoracaceae bacterium]